MAILSTPVQGLPYPDQNEKINSVDEYIRNLALALEKKLVMVFSSAADRDTKLPSPAEGQFVYLTDVNKMYVRVVSGTTATWNQIYPATPGIYSGTTAPAATLGSVGDIYIQYS